jgi:hypothetical protein
MISILEAAKAIQQFEKDSLTNRISAIETKLLPPKGGRFGKRLKVA